MHSLIEKASNHLPKSLDLQQLNNYLPVFFNVLIIVACSYTLAQVTWLLIPVEEGRHAPTTQNSANTAARLKSEQQQKIQQISNAHLFGQYQAKASPVVQQDAPETRLNLILKGVLAVIPMENASAIIALGKRGKESTYGIGDRVSSATVSEIYADRVILKRSGRYETLRLPKDPKSTGLIKHNSRSSTNNAPRASRHLTPGQVLGNIRKKIMKNPTSFGQYAIPIPYHENGKLRGYKLQPQKDRALFDQVGLSPDDVIINVNGISLNNPANGLKALRALQKAKQVTITVLRNGAEIPLSFEIP